MCSKTETLHSNYDDTLGYSIKLSAPGKVILFGEHSVVYGKLALAASLGLRTHLNFIENFEDDHQKIVLNFEAVKLYHSYDINDIKRELFNDSSSKILLDKPELNNHEKILSKVQDFISKYGGSAPIQKSQHQALVAFFYLFISMTNQLDVTSFTITVKSDLHIGAGLGSSASFLVVISAAFYKYFRFKTENLSVEDLNELSFNNLEFNKKKFTEKDLELISKWAYNAEKIIHGTPSGLDNTICTYGMMVEFKKGGPITPLILNHKLSVILINSQVPKDTKVQVEKVACLKAKYPEVVNSILNAMEEIALKASTTLKSLNIENKDEVDKILDDCVNINQGLLQSLGVSHISLNNICNILLEKKLHGKLTGAGGGGYAFGFIPEGYAKEDLDFVIKNLEKNGYESKIIELGGAGLINH
nr:mevalonate kinase [Onthophagus taurus]